jgi:serine protease AprX
VENGVVVCVAAGNMGPAGHTIGSPGAAERVITVGACEAEPAESGDEVADFSSRGPTATGQVKPDVVFPGVGIVAPRASGSALGVAVGADYMSLSGTSQATPFATGTAALLLQANPRLSPEDVKTRLLRGARRLAGAGPNEQGHGRGDSYNTFVAAEGAPLEEGSGVPTAPEEPTPPLPAGCLSAVTLGWRVGAGAR